MSTNYTHFSMIVEKFPFYFIHFGASNNFVSLIIDKSFHFENLLEE